MKKDRKQREYTSETLQKEREYGMFWYSWLWTVLRPAVIALCVFLVVAGIGMAVWNRMQRSYFSPMDPRDDQTYAFTVESGSSLTRVANNLESAGLIHDRTVFKYYADFLGYGQKIQAGQYMVKRSMSMQQIMELLTTGDGNPITRNITIIPGWSVADIARYLKDQGVISDEQAFLERCRTGSDYAAYYYISDVLANNPQNRLYVLEGYLAPDTYEIYTNASADDVIRKLLSQTEAVFRPEYHDRAQTIGMSMDQVITLASLIEKEAKTADFAKVSAVFHNRLDRQNMPLQSDVTVKYITGIRRMALTKTDLAVNSLYNTYRQPGLPPGPICSPSAAAIYAALYPDEQYMEQGYLYFCSKDPSTGELYFSRTKEDHDQAVEIYKPLWQAYDQQQGLQ